MYASLIANGIATEHRPRRQSFALRYTHRAECIDIEPLDLTMQYIDAEQVHATLDYPGLIAGLDRCHNDDTEIREDMLLGQSSDSGDTNHLFIRAAWQRGRALGAKVTTRFPDNPMKPGDLPAIHALYTLFDGDTGIPIACIDGTALTLRKTAADSALGAKYLARTDVENMLMLGAGALAPHLIMAHHAARPSIRGVTIWNRTPERAAAVAAALAIDGVTISTTPDLDEAARNADLICCATATVEPVLKGSWLKPGAHVDLIGAFTKTMREADDDVLRRGSLFVDSRATTVGDIGELVIPIAAGVITEADILADHYDLCRGQHPGRRNDDEITVFKNGGGGHLDLMTARLVMEANSS